jgi:hypothetical protein
LSASACLVGSDAGAVARRIILGLYPGFPLRARLGYHGALSASRRGDPVHAQPTRFAGSPGGGRVVADPEILQHPLSKWGQKCVTTTESIPAPNAVTLSMSRAYRQFLEVPS